MNDLFNLFMIPCIVIILIGLITITLFKKSRYEGFCILSIGIIGFLILLVTFKILLKI